MYVCPCIYRCTYLCMYACMRVCMYACVYACMHHVSMMIVCLVGHMRLPWVDGRWQPELAGRKRAKWGEKLPGGLGRAKHVGGAVRVFKMWWAQNECLFVCPKLCGGYPLQLWHSQGWGEGGRFSWRMVGRGCRLARGFWELRVLLRGDKIYPIGTGTWVLRGGGACVTGLKLSGQLHIVASGWGW